MRAGQRVLLRHRDHEGLVEQRALHQAVGRHRQREDAHVDVAGLQVIEHRTGLVFVQQQFDARQLLADARRHQRQQVRTDGGQQRHAQAAGQRIALQCGQRDDLVAGLDDAARARDHLGAGLGQRDAPRVAFHQLHAEVVLELLQLRRQRGLADEAARRRLAEMARVGHRHEVAQVLELQVGH